MSSSLPSPPPPYSSAAPSARQRVPTQVSSRLIPDINIFLLGSPGVGKSTFLSQLPYVRDGRLQRTFEPQSLSNLAVTSAANPSTFNVSLFARPYNIVIYRPTSPIFVDPFPEKVDVLVLCFAIDDRISLFNAQKYWRRVFAERYEAELGVQVPVMLMGFKRDLRTDQKEMISGIEAGTDKEEFTCVMPEQGLRAAREMRCDRYAECSATTGELMFEVLEDLTRMAAGTTTRNGGFSQMKDCSVM
jgi:Ras family protein A